MRVILRSVSVLVLALGAAKAQSDTASSERRPLVIKVVDSDRGSAVSSTIFRLASAGGRARLGSTDSLGVASIPLACGVGDLLEAEPTSPAYLKGRVDCPPVLADTLFARVTRKIVYMNLTANAELRIREGDYATAALLYAEKANKLVLSGSGLASSAQDSIVVLFSEHLKLDGEQAYYYRPDGSMAFTTLFTDRISSFQAQKGLRVTGYLDYMTLKVDAKADVGHYTESVVPPASKKKP